MELGSFSIRFPRQPDVSRPDPDVLYDLVIIGGGPAAMAAAIYAARKTMKTSLITKDFGGQVAWTSEVANYIGFQSITGADLVDRFVQHVRQFALPISLGTPVDKVTRSDSGFSISLDNGEIFTSRAILVATGKRYRRLNIPGELEFTGKGVAYCATCDAPFYKGRTVIVAGGGNSAVGAAHDLLNTGARSVTVINLNHKWIADRCDLNRLQERPGAALLELHEILRINGHRAVESIRIRDRRNGQERDVSTDGVFVEIGLIPNSEPVKGLLALNDRDEIIVDCLCQTNVPGAYAAGDVTTVPHKQIIIAGGEGAKAALTAYEYLMEGNLHGTS